MLLRQATVQQNLLHFSQLIIHVTQSGAESL